MFFNQVYNVAKGNNTSSNNEDPPATKMLGNLVEEIQHQLEKSIPSHLIAAAIAAASTTNNNASTNGSTIAQQQTHNSLLNPNQRHSSRQINMNTSSSTVTNTANHLLTQFHNIQQQHLNQNYGDQHSSNNSSQLYINNLGLMSSNNNNNNSNNNGFFKINHQQLQNNPQHNQLQHSHYQRLI
jgi:hypothetical protein